MAELIDKDALIKEIESVSFTEDAKKMKVTSDAEMDGFFKGYVEGMLYFLPTTTEAEIRAKAEHTYENCHNITCRRKCQKDGYNMAIDEFARKLLINFNDWQMSVAEVGNEKEYETIGKAIIGIEEIAERLKERD